EIVHHHKTPAQEVCAHALCLTVGESPAPGLHGIEPAVVEQVVEITAQHMSALMRVDARQALNRAREVIFGTGVIHVPGTATHAGAAVGQPREGPFGWRPGRWLTRRGAKHATTEATLSEQRTAE